MLHLPAVGTLLLKAFEFDSLQDAPEPNRVLGVFGLSLYTTERDLFQIFKKFGPIERVQVVLDAQVRQYLCGVAGN